MAKSTFYGYRIVAAGFTIQMMYLGSVYTFGALFPEFEKEFGWSRASIAGAASLFFLIFGSFGIVVGSASDRFGPRIVLTACGIVFSIGFLLLHRVNELWQLYLFYGVLGGLGMAAHEVATLSTIARWFKKNRGLMSGIVKAGSGIGQAFIPLVAATLIADYGWRSSCFIIGITSLVVMVLAAQYFRKDPTEIGLKAFGEDDKNEKNFAPSQGSLPFKAVLKSRPFWILSLSKFADMFCLFTIITHIVPHGIDQGLASPVSITVLSSIGASSILGRLIFGMGYDLLGPRHSLMICFFTLLVSFVIIQTIPDPKLLFLFAFIYGIAHGGFFAIASPSIADYFGTKSHGIIFGIVLFCGTLGGTIGPLTAGRVFDITKSYDITFITVSGAAIFGLALAYHLQNPRKTN